MSLEGANLARIRQQAGNLAARALGGGRVGWLILVGGG